MRIELLFKLLQRHTYTCLSHRYGIYCAFAGLVVVLYSMFQFGEEMLEWSQSQYDSLFSFYHDNIAGQTYQAMLAAPIPIDVVYTWVNGSDPILIKQLSSLKRSLNSGDLASNSSKNPSHFSQCTQKDCFVLPCLLAYPNLGEEVAVDDLQRESNDFSELKWVTNLKVAKDFVSNQETNVTLLRFVDKKKLSKVLTSVKDENRTFAPVYITTAKSAQKSSFLPNALVLKGIPDKIDSTELKEKLPVNLKAITEWIYVSGVQNLALVWTNDPVTASKILDPKDNSTLAFFGIEQSKVDILAAYILATVEEETQDDMARSRFEDNEELRYSLRSMEKYAPWVRKIFIVTNGQIPYWLNMDNPRLEIITHEDIFPNGSHLPTFSSPAIEAHIHRIPGLAQKFIYMNDDVMFGRRVWPDDFYTPSFGQKVYLTWPVPNCADGCAPSWIKDGFCDAACNVSDCSWDGGDCLGDNVRPGVGVGGGGGYSYSTTSYCYPGCADSWLADKFCDQSCNKEDCGFDAGDCGLSNFDKIYRIRFKTTNGTTYHIPPGIKNAYIDFTKHFKKISKAEYEKDKSIRAAAVSNKYNVTTFVYRPNGNSSNITVTLWGVLLEHRNSKGDTGPGNESLTQIQFNLLAEPSKNITYDMKELNKKNDEDDLGQTSPSVNSSVKAESKPEDDFMDIVPFEEEMKQPHIVKLAKDETELYEVVLPEFIDTSILPENVREKLESLEQDFAEEILTESGYKRRKLDLLRPYIDALKAVDSGKNLTEEAIANNPKLQRKKGVEKRSIMNLSEVDDAVKDVKEDPKDEEDLSETGHLHKKGDPGEDLVKTEKPRPPIFQRKVVQPQQSNQLQKNPFYRLTKDLLKKGQNVSKGNYTNPASFGGRKLLSIDDDCDEVLDRILLHDQPKKSADTIGFLPWEQEGVFDLDAKKIEEDEKRKRVMVEYRVDSDTSSMRKPLDTFADSLRYVSNLYNKDFGFTQRKVPAHMPHFIDRDIMYELQARYPKQYEMTSSHKLRHSQDMQFAFSYYYYVMSAVLPLNFSKVFLTLDTDKSGVLSDREIRLFATRTHTLPLTLQELTNIEKNIISCAWELYGPKKEGNSTDGEHRELSDLQQPLDGIEIWATTESYYDKDMPLVTEHLFKNCPFITDLIQKTFGEEKKYRHQVMDEEEITFKMIRNNVSTVVGQLDDIRKSPKKFICLNDNIDHHNSKDAEMVKAVLRDFYETFFPKESQFELPPEYRNRFLDVYSLRQWKDHRDYVSWWLRTALVILLSLTVLSMVWDKVSNSWRAKKNLLLRKLNSFNIFSTEKRERKRKPSNV